MLVIDDNMFRLAKMQETLLKVSVENRDENLKKYRDIVMEIDTKAFADLLEEVKHINEHNQSLEDELQFLEGIKNAYNQLLELQLGFKNVCELYGDNNLILSNLARLNIEYIDDRISTISGYLINIKNIDDNKKKIQELNEQLVIHEKKKVLYDNRLESLEQQLKLNFISAEGRSITIGEATQPVSIVSEYKELGLDFEQLLDDHSLLESTLLNVENNQVEKKTELEATQFCYDQNPNIEYRKFLDDVKVEYCRLKYKVAMLKMIRLLSLQYDDIEQCKDKRRDLLDLIKYRKSYLLNLGIRLVIDPFDRVGLNEQLEVILSFDDKSKKISDLRRQIGELNSRTEAMLKENSNYLISLGNTKSLIENSVYLDEINESSLSYGFEDVLLERIIEPNQVVSVKSITDDFNINIVRQKTSSVIRRVGKMLSGYFTPKKVEVKTSIPELVIVPKKIEELKEEIIDEPIDIIDATIGLEPMITEDNNIDNANLIETSDSIVVDNQEVIDINSLETQNLNDANNGEVVEEIPVLNVLPVEANNISFDNLDTNKFKTVKIIEPIETLFMDTASIFETTVPFEEPVLFTDRTDEVDSSEVHDNAQKFIQDEMVEVAEKTEESKEINVVNGIPRVEESMPEAFWITQSEEKEETTNSVLSFDEQINMLLATEKEDSKTRKKVA